MLLAELTALGLPLYLPNLIGSIERDAIALLRLNAREDTALHSMQAVKISTRLAGHFQLEEKPAKVAAYLHDIADILPSPVMLEYARRHQWPLDDGEKHQPYLLHQRFSACIAEEHFGVTDARILSAIGCHATLKADPAPYDMLLFLADKLAADPAEVPQASQDLILEALEVSLEQGVLVYLDDLMKNRPAPCPHQWLLAAYKRSLRQQPLPPFTN